MVVLQFAFIIHRTQAKHQALARRHVAEHLGNKVLYHLERSDRLSKLQSLLGVCERMLVGAHLAPRRHPPHNVTRHA